MTQACTRAERNVPLARRAVQASQASNRARRQTRDELLGALDRLNKVLTRCSTEFEDLSRPGQGEAGARVRQQPSDTRSNPACESMSGSWPGIMNAMGIKTNPGGSRIPAVAGLKGNVDSHVHMMLMEPVFRM